MSWTRPTIKTIYARIKADMESRVTEGVSIPKVSLLGIMALVFSGGVHLTYGFLEWIAKQIFVDTASIEGLTRWGNIFGLPRKAATFTSGTVSFTGTAAHVVAAGTAFVNSEGYEYTTDDAFTIGTTTSVTATASASGAEYNSEDTEMTLSSPDADIDSSVTVVSGFDDGADLESLEAWVIRLLQRLQNPPASGTPSDYVRWALEVSGVGKAWCYPAEEWLGAGTTGIGLSDENLDGVTAGVLSDVEDYIDTVRPIPAEIDYFTVVPQATVYSISLSPNTSDLQDAIDEQLRLFHLLEAEPGGTLLLSRIRSAIAAAGPDDYEITDISVGGASIGVDNITTTVPDIAQFDSVSYSDL